MVQSTYQAGLSATANTLFHDNMPFHPDQSGFQVYHQVLRTTSKLGMLVPFFIIDMYHTAALYSTSIGFLYHSTNSNCD